MTEDKPGDERSMSEILASIRKIVTDEERTRRAAEDRRAEENAQAAAAPAPVLELTAAMRAAPALIDGPAGGGNAVPLDLGRAAVLVSAPAPLRAARPDLDEIEAIVRRVVREELKGPVGLEISRKVKASIHEEVRRALADDEPLI